MRIFRSFITLFFMLSILTTNVWGQIPQSSDSTFIIPAQTGIVNDYETLYTPAETKTLDSVLQNFYTRTGVAMILLTLKTNMVAKDSLFLFINHIFNAWQPGRQTGNGVIVAICKGYRTMRIENGYNITDRLSDAATKRIIDTNFIPGFKTGNYYEGTLNGLRALMATLDNK